MIKQWSNAEWKVMMDKSNKEAKEWLTKNSEHLEKLDDWLNTTVKIVEMDSAKKTYNGDIRELIGKVRESIWVCSFIEKRMGGQTFDLEKLVENTFLPVDKVYERRQDGRLIDALIDTHEESKRHGMYVATVIGDFDAQKLNLITLCNAILKLNTYELTALNAMLCSNDMIRSAAWSMLVKEKRLEQGHVLFYNRPDHKPEDSVGGPWVKSSSSGGKRTKRHKKRSGKRSGHKRSGHKRSGKRINKRMSRRR